MSDHVWVQENLGVYLADGLSIDERVRFERHLAECSSCSRSVAESRQVEQFMEDLFMPKRPDPALADRMIRSLRQPWLRHLTPARVLLRFVAGVAAMILLAALGMIVHLFAAEGDLPFPGLERRVDHGKAGARNYLTQIFGGIHHGTNIIDEKRKDGIESMTPEREDMSNKDSLELAKDSLADFSYGIDRITQQSIPGSVNPNEAFKIPVMGVPPARLPSMGPPNGEVMAGQNSTFGTVGDKIGSSDSTHLHSNIPALQTPSSTSTAKPKTSLYFRFNEQNQTDPAEAPPANKTPTAAEPGEPASKAPNKRASSTTKAVDFDDFLVGEKMNDPAETTSRKIIRTGELDFEVDAFDAAVDTITKLITNIKGAFIATVNSDKLPNGKMRGSVVVRMPPVALDPFIGTMRRELAKTGELKSQKIGSQDISKQYTDVESRLRAARSMEERLLNIIKTGKGEIKDLIVAERELGVWRTKIEEMEGEIRFYSNQVSLSTLTIHLTEKEIQAPSALIVTEHVGIRIEVEDVKKSHEAALKAVEEVKGRITKSELKQHAVGQLEGVVHAEVAPGAEAKFRASIEKLGLVRHQDAQQLQKSEGGSGQPQELKPRYKDIHFEIVLYNSANIQPRETYTLQIATLDVPGSYHKLQDEITRAHGQVRTGQLTEQDKTNTVAQFDFDVPASEKLRIEQLIRDLGPTFSRSNQQVPVQEIATDRKIGYRLTIRNVAGMPPREKVVMTVEVQDVDARAARLTDLVRASKGLVSGSQIHHNPNEITATLFFDVPLSAQETLVEEFKRAGVVRHHQSSRNPQVPENELATAHIELTLTSAGTIVPSEEGLWNQIRRSLYVSFKVLSWSLMLVILGLCVVLPWTLVLWIAYRLVRRLWGPRTQTTPVV